MYENNMPTKRYKITKEFLLENCPPPKQILDLGIVNPFTSIMEEAGYGVTNTNGEDLDIDFSPVQAGQYDVVTAFEIFEHLVAPFNILREIKAPELVCSVPLNLWFAKAYWNEKDIWDRHYHEFEERQFNWLLDKAGWDIKATKTWTNPGKGIGIRPILRRFTPRYYAVYATKR